MGMQLTIKSDEAYALASRLVELTGQSLTVAVTEALRQRLAAKEKARGKEAWIKEVQAVAADIRAELTTDGKPIDLTANFFIMKRRVCLFDHRQLAIMAVVMNEPDATTILSAMSNTTRRKISARTWLEACLVVNQRNFPVATARLENLLKLLALKIVAVTAEQASVARRAYERFGRGNHPARLNYGDCFAYALAKVSGEPLLFKGNDFSQTDIRSAI